MEDKKLIHSIGKVAKREFNRITERKTLYLLAVVLPFVVSLVLFLIFKNGMVHQIPVAIFDEDHSELSTMITRFIQSTPSMSIVTYANSLEEVKQDFRRGKVQAAFHFPENMEAIIKNGRQTNVEIFINSMNLLNSNSVLNDGAKIIKTVSGGALVKKLGSAGVMQQQAMDIASPIKLDTKILFNPGYNYEVYLVPALASFALHMVTLLIAVLLVSAEFSENTFADLLNTADNKISAIIIGKAIPHLAIQSLNVIILLGVFFPLFNVSIAGSSLTAILFTIFFLAVIFFFGLMISSLIHDQMLSTEAALFLTTPAFIFSGLSFPLRIMPVIHSTYAQLMPYTYFIEGFVKIYQMGAPVEYLTPQIIKLSIFLIISITITVPALKYNLKKYGLHTERNK